jgi:hypothetical protein
MTAPTGEHWTGRLRRPLVLIGVALLGGCALLGENVEAPPPAAPPAQAALPPAEAPLPPPIPARKPVPPPLGGAMPISPVERSDPEHVIGMTPSEAVAWLGQPEQRSEAAPATIWRYAAPGCEVELYFYLDLQSKVTRVLHYEIRSNDGADRRRERCFEQLVAERRAHAGTDGGTDRPR